ncbi:MAG: aminoacyl-tRNA hydrolase, partial [Bacteroidales bacterium]
MKYLIAGLGNIGPEYHETRHNIGFMVLDHLAAQKEVAFEPARYGDITEFRHKGRIFTLLKPSTYMNLSGKAIHYWLTQKKVELENLLVVVDDVALPLGALRMKAKGGAGGHNGLSHIIDILGTDQYARLRFGIGGDFPKGFQVQYVVGKWEPFEMEIIEPRIKMAAEMIVSFGMQGPERTMN